MFVPISMSLNSSTRVMPGQAHDHINNVINEFVHREARIGTSVDRAGNILVILIII